MPSRSIHTKQEHAKQEQATQEEATQEEAEELATQEAKKQEAYERMREAMAKARTAMEHNKQALEESGHVLRRMREPLARMRGTLRAMPRGMQIHSGGHDPVAMLKMHADELELTDDQKERIGEIKRGYERAAIEREAAIKIAKLDLDGLKGAEDLDLGAIEAKLGEVAGLKVQGEMDDLRLKRDLHAVLTAEQLEKAKKLAESPMANVFMRRYAKPFEAGEGLSWVTPDMEHFEFKLPDDMEFGWVDEFEGPMLEGHNEFMFAPEMDGEFNILEMPEHGAFFLKDGEFENLEEMIESGELEHIESPDGDVYIWVTPDGEEHRIEIRKKVKKKETKEEIETR